MSARWSVVDAEDSAEIENVSSGGSALTDDTEVAVSATGPSPASAVMTATPPGWPRKRSLKLCGGSEVGNDACARAGPASAAGVDGCGREARGDVILRR